MMKKSLTLFVSLSLLALFNFVTAQTWTQAGPYAGNITGITSTSTLLFAGAKNEYSSGGAWTSADNGETWNNVIDNIPGKIVQTVGSLGDVLFVTAQAHQDNTGTTYTDGGIYRSDDNGLTWTQPWAAGASTIINCLYSTGTTIFATTTTGPYRSVDNGVTWALARTGLNTGLSRAGKCFLTCGDTLFIGTRAGVYRSVNNGTNWIISTAGIPLTGTTAFPGWITGMTKCGSTLYASTFSQGVFKSADKGINWVAANNGLPEMNLGTIYTSGNAIYTSTKMHGVFKSTDNGASWVLSTLGLPNMEICCFLQSGTKLLAGGFDGIYQTIDNGQNWTSTNNNLAGHAIKAMIKAGNYLITGTYSGRVYRSADEGASWQQANGTMRSPNGSLGWINALGSVGSTVFVSYYDSMYRSNDWGDTWTSITSENILNTQIYSMATLNSRIFAANGTILYSDDAGLTWNHDNDLTAASNICIKGEDVFVSAGINVSRSVSGTGPFTLMGSLPASAGNITCIAVLKDKLYAGSGQGYTGQGVFKSADNGLTWTNAGLADSLIYGITVVSEKLFAKTKYSVMQKNTSDDSWVEVSTGLPFNFMGAYGSALFGNNGTLYSAVAASSLYKADVSQFNPPLQPGVISGPAEPCIGSTQTYSITNVPGVIYTWLFPADWIITEGGTTSSVTVIIGNTSGIVMVTPSNDYGTGPAQFMGVTPALVLDAAISIEVDQNNVCAGTTVTFTASPVNGGETPVYQWYINDVESGENNPVFSYIPANNDSVSVQLTSSLGCALNNPVQSDSIVLLVTDLSEVTASISVVQNNLCEGNEMAFYATTTGGGSQPEFNWFVNGESAGANAESFSYIPANGDLISLIFTSSELCTTENPVESNTVAAIVNAMPVVSWPVFEPDTICENESQLPLTGGIPEGGVYTGTGVSDNVFYPAVAGFGSHEITYTYSDGNNCSDQAALTLFVDICEGVPVLNTSVIVYPNPATDMLNIQLGNAQPIEKITLYNSIGMKVFERLDINAIGAASIKVSDLSRGIYIVKITGRTEIFVKSIILQ